MKIITYNVNGIRAAIRKDFISWLSATNADVVCLQEIKIQKKDFPYSLFEELGYECYIYPAQKAGYSGVAILSKRKPQEVVFGCGISRYDEEGRILRAVYEDVTVMSVYMPSGASRPERQQFKLTFLEDFYDYIQDLKATVPPLVICGDYNICHRAIDIHNPKANANSPGFTPTERAWFSNFLDLGYVDAFRHFNKEPHHYTWWSFKANARARNLGWRIDYQLIDSALIERAQKCVILSEAKHSDHCPVLSEID
ncbi:MAG: exodeoxyribonuclease III [Thermonemataceae bacterium]